MLSPPIAGRSPSRSYRWRASGAPSRSRYRRKLAGDSRMVRGASRTPMTCCPVPAGRCPSTSDEPLTVASVTGRSATALTTRASAIRSGATADRLVGKRLDVCPRTTMRPPGVTANASGTSQKSCAVNTEVQRTRSATVAIPDVATANRLIRRSRPAPPRGPVDGTNSPTSRGRGQHHEFRQFRAGGPWRARGR